MSADRAIQVEATLQANANQQFIALQMAEVIREFLRATASRNDNGMRAAEQMEFVSKLLVRCEEPLSWRHIFADALTMLRVELPKDQGHENYISIALEGMKFFVESTATDNFATARAKKQLNVFRDAIKRHEDYLQVSTRSSEVERLLAKRLEELGKSK